MKNKLFLILGMLSAINCYADDSGTNLKANIQAKNIHGVVSAGTWFNLALQDNIIASTGSQHFTATLVDPILNENLSEGLIPAKSTINGTYRNNGSKCSFEIDSITFKGTTIDLLPGAYSNVIASLPNQPDCNPNMNYSPSQQLEFQTKVDIENLTPIVRYKDYTITNKQDNFVQSFGNSDYRITGITKFTDGLMEVSVKFYNLSIKDKLVPVYFDEFGLPHCLNFTLITEDENSNYENIYSYLVLAKYNKFGFGILD